jgi:hypothetical protein
VLVAPYILRGTRSTNVPVKERKGKAGSASLGIISETEFAEMSREEQKKALGG